MVFSLTRVEIFSSSFEFLSCNSWALDSRSFTYTFFLSRACWAETLFLSSLLSRTSLIISSFTTNVQLICTVMLPPDHSFSMLDIPNGFIQENQPKRHMLMVHVSMTCSKFRLFVHMIIKLKMRRPNLPNIRLTYLMKKLLGFGRGKNEDN